MGFSTSMVSVLIGWGLEDSFGLGDNDYDDMLVRFTIASTS